LKISCAPVGVALFPCHVVFSWHRLNQLLISRVTGIYVTFPLVFHTEAKIWQTFKVLIWTPRGM